MLLCIHGYNGRDDWLILVMVVRTNDTKCGLKSCVRYIKYSFERVLYVKFVHTLFFLWRAKINTNILLGAHLLRIHTSRRVRTL